MPTLRGVCSPSIEFLTFVEHAERELWGLFQTIDRDHNGKLDKSELQMAFAKAGVVIDNVKLARFFDRIDANHDEEITFDEWRFVQMTLFHSHLTNV